MMIRGMVAQAVGFRVAMDEEVMVAVLFGFVNMGRRSDGNDPYREGQDAGQSPGKRHINMVRRLAPYDQTGSPTHAR
jgi:hypothetical protein